MKIFTDNRHVFLIELLFIFGISIIVFLLSARFDVLESLVLISQKHEEWELDEVIPVCIFLVLAFTIILIRRFVEIQRIQKHIEYKNRLLQDAIKEIKQLKGIVPICSHCKNIRDDKGFWHQVEAYIQTHSEAKFSHGICPDCIEKIYPEVMSDPKVIAVINKQKMTL